MADRCKECGGHLLKDKMVGFRCPRCPGGSAPAEPAPPPKVSKERSARTPPTSKPVCEERSVRTSEPQKPALKAQGGRGGARAGAGRKASEAKATAVTVSLPADLLTRLDAYSATKGLSRSGAVAALLGQVLQ